MEMKGAAAATVALRRSKWVATAASIWIQCTSGSSYCFGIYSPLLKSSQSYDQSTLDSVAFFKDVGANVGVLSGLLYSYSSPSSSDHRPSCSSSGDVSSRRRAWKGGPWIVIAAGAVQGFVGYFFMWLSITGMLPRPPVALMCLYMFLAAHSQTFFNTADVVTAVQNFPDSRGTGVGIMKGFLGLSGAILIQIYRTVYAGEPSNFILMLALLSTIIPLLLMFLVNVRRTYGEDDMKHLNGFSIISLMVAGYLMVIIIWENIMPLESHARVAAFVILLLFLLSPFYVAITAHLKGLVMVPADSYPERNSLINDSDTPRTGGKVERGRPCTKYDNTSYDQLPADFGHELSYCVRRGDLNILQAIRTAEFWLLFFAMSCGMGSGLATVNNISQIGGSLGYSSVQISTMVSLWSIWNFLGRFGAGYVSDYYLNSKGYPRPLFIAVTLAIMSIGHAVISSGLFGALYVGSILVGVCYGCQWSLMPTITSELFGIVHMGTIFNTISIASPLGSYLLSVRVVGYIYDMEAKASGMGTCTGTHCFRLSFLIMALVSISGFTIALALFFRTRKFYEQIIVARLRHSSLS